MAALRRLRFVGKSRDAEVAARTAIAALGVAAIAYGHEADHDLRSRCLLIPQHPPGDRDGRTGRRSPPTLSVLIASPQPNSYRKRRPWRRRSGNAWEEAEIALKPAPKLIELLRRSRGVSAREPVGE